MKGLRARGGFEIANLEWTLGRVTKVSVTSTLGGNLRIRSNEPLMMADGTPLTLAEGNNANPLNQPYNMPAPKVKDATKIPATNLPVTYLYDIPTSAGQTINLVSKNVTAINKVSSQGISDLDQNMKLKGKNLCNAIGQRVTDAFRGIIISNGQKFIK